MSQRSDRWAEFMVLAALIVAVFIVAFAGQAITSPEIGSWYARVVKPSFNPPNWVFAPVWTILYLSMAIAAWLVWREAGWPMARRALLFWVVQLLLNLAWSFLFFGLHRIGWSLAEIAILFVAIALTIVEFRKFSGLAALLMVPYLAWVGYAGILNFAIWRLNQ